MVQELCAPSLLPGTPTAKALVKQLLSRSHEKLRRGGPWSLKGSRRSRGRFSSWGVAAPYLLPGGTNRCHYKFTSYINSFYIYSPPLPPRVLTGDSGGQWVEPAVFIVLELKYNDDAKDLERSLGLSSCPQTGLTTSYSILVKINPNCS